MKRRWDARWVGIGLAVATSQPWWGRRFPWPRQQGSERRRAGRAWRRLRLAAQEELYCADWIASCAALSWGNWSLGNHTLPQALRVTPTGEYVPGPMLVE